MDLGGNAAEERFVIKHDENAEQVQQQFQEFINEMVKVTACVEHYGHDTDRGKVRVREDQKVHVAAKLKTGLTVPQVVKQLQDDDIVWTQCDNKNCDLWYHNTCIKQQLADCGDTQFFCEICTPGQLDFPTLSPNGGDRTDDLLDEGDDRPGFSGSTAPPLLTKPRYEDAEGNRIYMDAVRQLNEPERNTLTVVFSHLQDFNGDFATTIMQDFYRMYPYLCRALQLVAIDVKLDNCHKKELYVSIDAFDYAINVRELTASKVGRLVKICGQVVRTHPVHPELCRATFSCEECNSLIRNVEQQFKYTQPTKCSNPACMNRTKFRLEVHKSQFVDFQKVRVQETQAELPRGSIPRSVEIILRGESVEKAQPGDRCDFTGTLIVIPDVVQLSIPGMKTQSSAKHRGREGYDDDGLKGLKALGVRDLNYKMAFLACNLKVSNQQLGSKDFTSRQDVTVDELWTELDKNQQASLKQMTEDKRIVRNLLDSLFPTIYGNEEVKQGVLLMLFGGVPKRTTEGTTLRGDINVCIVGDPSTGKSQVLKKVEEFCPRAVYTSGKASSAAGLTAAVIKDEESSEFVIEAGALMLADNGVCCIDEFDKMDLKDQVAIHEAMEQQTISITKAGVKATLNARTSILAAANPVGGRYDPTVSLRKNIQLSAPIMSRFDLFFVLVDDPNETNDYMIAQRILDTHRMNDRPVQQQYSVQDIQTYIQFARCFKPTISEDASVELVQQYAALRQRDSSGSLHTSSWRITVRQLESLIRLSEALAKLHCTQEVTVDHVREASKLLNKSIVRVEQPEVALDEDEEQREREEQEMQDELDARDEAEQNENGTPAKKTKLSFEEYRKMANMLVYHLQRSEKEEGVRKSELIEWYFNEIPEHEMEDVEDVTRRKKILDKVIDRLVKTDNILIELPRREGEEEDMEDPIMVVHPNYDPEDE